MKSYISFFYFLFVFSFSFGQYGDLGIRQKFDQVYQDIYLSSQFSWTANGLYYGTESSTESNQNNLGSYRAQSLDALLVMYEATCDTTYLMEFMRLTTEIMNARADKVSPQFSSSPYWFKDKVVWHGRILMPLSKYVYLTSSQWQSLWNVSIDPNVYGGKSTIGEFSNWVNQNNIEVMDFLLGRYWNSSTKCMCKPSESEPGPTISQPCNNTVSELNFQTPFGCALIYMYLKNSSRTDYGVKAVNMAQAHLISNGGIYTYNSYHKAYTWMHNGWKESGGYKEDIAHGGTDILFPILYNKFRDRFSSITSGMYFEDYQMVRLKNTFSRLVYNYGFHSNINYYHDINKAFNANVDSSNTGQYPGENNQNIQTNLQLNSITWVDLYKFDNTSGSYGYNVYDILMNFYDYKVKNLASSNFWGIKIKGLADLVAANYSSENINSGCYTKSSSLNNDDLNIKEEDLPKIIYHSDLKNLSFSTNQENEKSKMTVYSSSGRLVANLDNSDQSIDMNKFSAGIYIVNLITENKIETKKIIVH